MQYKAVFFDLDGTLLPLDQDYFVKVYFKALSEKMAQIGCEPKEFLGAIMKGIDAMRVNDGTCTNEERFRKEYYGIYKGAEAEHDAALDDFYENEFQNIRSVTGCEAAAAEIVSSLKAKGIPMVIATNPVFPPYATRSRVCWAGLDIADFEMITTYDNVSYCKPNPDYYRDLCERIGVSPEDCVMVGNDVDDDMIAETIGMKVFLLTDNLVNRQNKDITVYNRGSFAELKKFLGV